MAIKGKKKSQNRGSQARRRPAAAPRPAYAAAARQPWHRTPGGQVTIGVILALLFGLGSWAFLGARSDARELDRQRDELDRYTTDLRGVIQGLDEPVGAMSTIPLESSPELVDTLADAPEQWIKQLTEAGDLAAQLRAPQPVTNIHQVFSQAVALYSAAAETYALVPEADGKLQPRLLQRAADERDQATGFFFSAIALLDGERIELDMGSSRLEAPGAPEPIPTPQAIPTPLVSVPVDEEGGGGNATNRKKKGSGGNN